MIIVADNLRITGKSIAAAVDAADPFPVEDMVKRCLHAGAHAIDINSGPLSRNPEKMTFLVRCVRNLTDFPLFIDTANPRAMAFGIDAAGKNGIINGVSLKPERLQAILPLAAESGADVVGYLLKEDGQVPESGEERMRVAVDLVQACRDFGIEAERLIIDPIIAPLSWSNGHIQNRETLEVIRRLPELIGIPVRSIAGLSNLTTGLSDPQQKQKWEAAYLPMLAAAGLDIVLMDVLREGLVTIAKTSAVMLDDGIFSWEMA